MRGRQPQQGLLSGHPAENGLSNMSDKIQIMQLLLLPSGGSLADI